MNNKNQSMTLMELYKEDCKKKGWDESPDLLLILEAMIITEENFTNFQQSNHWLKQLLKPKAHAPHQGIYLWGPVGRGKTYLMDLFYEHVSETKRKRWHFTEFMQLIHELLAEFSHDKSQLQKKGQPIQWVANHLANSCRLICLDEFQVTEIAEAMILYRLFDYLLQRGVFFVVTSNSSPEQLYKGGLHFDRFEPFIHLIKKRWKILAFDHEGIDYRRLSQKDNPEWRKSHTGIFPTSNNLKRLSDLEKKFTDIETTEGKELGSFLINNRHLIFPRATSSALWVSFSELCEQPYGPAEFQAIAKHYGQVFITNIPSLGPENRDATRRFITLIDCLYDENVILHCHYLQGHLNPDTLYTEIGPTALPFARTASRLIQMSHEASPKERS